MVKQLTSQELQRRKNTLKAIEDYFGEKISEGSFKGILARVQGKRGELETDEEIKAAWSIKQNLSDEVYVRSLSTRG